MIDQRSVGQTVRAHTPYAGALVVMGTMHGKEKQVAQAFQDVLGARVVAPRGLDTDQFGTFTGDVDRRLSPIETARAKARLAMTSTGCSYGIASEATYSTQYAVLAVHEEILLFIDDVLDIEVVEGVNTPGAPGSPQTVRSASEAVDAARTFGFPEQGAAVKTMVCGNIRVFGKGLTDSGALAGTVEAALHASDTGEACVEPDLRAHHNPSRREVLTRLADRLAHRLATRCPACASPGYGKVAVSTGLPCAACGFPTSLIAADIHGCPACEYRRSIPRACATAEPRWCENCNP
ncbi:DUF6671 family protein [uncultured Mycobacterium sp.]|uniref:DUF6671 family protein n=1 Tax=uncultured Mycobacterium sp. TaxID=171292 RepID=UPI0035CB2343